MNIFLLCLLIFVFGRKSLAEIKICYSSQTIHMNTDEIVFFESLNFPKTIEEDCAMTFIVENYRNLESLRCIFVITNGMLDFTLTSNHTQMYGEAVGSEWPIIPYISQINDTYLTFETTIDNEKYNAFQGFIIAEDGAFGCPLESIATINPFNITNMKQIIYLTNFVASDFETTKNKTSCSWRFAAPRFYQFKLVILSFTGQMQTLQLLDGNGNIILLTNETVKLSYPYLIVGPYISITFQSAKVDSDDLFVSFSSYLTIHKPQTDFTEGNCTLTAQENTLIWTNIGFPLNGYQDNAYCFVNLTLFSNKMTIATIDEQKLEYDVDYIKYSIQDDEVVVTHDISGVAGAQFVFQSHPNGYNSYLIWEFFSDSSYTSLGFSITFSHMECACAPSNITVPCTSTQYTIMPDNEVYCGNLNCNFTISMDSTCSGQNLIMEIMEDNDAYGRPNANNFCVLSNNRTVVESVVETNTYLLLLPTNNTNIFLFQSAPAQKLATLIFILTPINAPIFLPTVFLTKSYTSHILHLGQILSNSVAPIMLNADLIKENDVLEIYVNSGSSFSYLSIYEDSSLIEIVVQETFFNPVDKYAIRYTSKTGKLFIYRYADIKFTDSDVIFLRARNEHSKNCLFKNIIFDARKAAISNNKITMTATTGPCTIHILNTPFFQEDYDPSNPLRNYIMTEFWTNSHQENVKIYTDNNDKDPFIEYVSSNASTWKDVTLGSQIYSIIIPNGKSVAIVFKAIFGEIPIGNYPYKSLWTSPFYGSPSQAYDMASCGSFVVEEHMSVKFTTKLFDVPKNFDGAITFAGINQYPTYVGETFFFSNTTISVFCETDGDKNIGVLLEIESFYGDFTNVTNM